jgi:hypothetical protein
VPLAQLPEAPQVSCAGCPAWWQQTWPGMHGLPAQGTVIGFIELPELAADDESEEPEEDDVLVDSTLPQAPTARTATRPIRKGFIQGWYQPRPIVARPLTKERAPRDPA